MDYTKKKNENNHNRYFEKRNQKQSSEKSSSSRSAECNSSLSFHNNRVQNNIVNSDPSSNKILRNLGDYPTAPSDYRNNHPRPMCQRKMVNIQSRLNRNQPTYDRGSYARNFHNIENSNQMHQNPYGHQANFIPRSRHPLNQSISGHPHIFEIPRDPFLIEPNSFNNHPLRNNYPEIQINTLRASEQRQINPHFSRQDTPNPDLRHAYLDNKKKIGSDTYMVENSARNFPLNPQFKGNVKYKKSEGNSAFNDNTFSNVHIGGNIVDSHSNKKINNPKNLNMCLNPSKDYYGPNHKLYTENFYHFNEKTGKSPYQNSNAADKHIINQYLNSNNVDNQYPSTNNVDNQYLNSNFTDQNETTKKRKIQRKRIDISSKNPLIYPKKQFNTVQDNLEMRSDNPPQNCYDFLQTNTKRLVKDFKTKERLLEQTIGDMKKNERVADDTLKYEVLNLNNIEQKSMYQRQNFSLNVESNQKIYSRENLKNFSVDNLALQRDFDVNMRNVEPNIKNVSQITGQVQDAPSEYSDFFTTNRSNIQKEENNNETINGNQPRVIIKKNHEVFNNHHQSNSENKNNLSFKNSNRTPSSINYILRENSLRDTNPKDNTIIPIRTPQMQVNVHSGSKNIKNGISQNPTDHKSQIPLQFYLNKNSNMKIAVSQINMNPKERSQMATMADFNDQNNFQQNSPSNASKCSFSGQNNGLPTIDNSSQNNHIHQNNTTQRDQNSHTHQNKHIHQNNSTQRGQSNAGPQQNKFEHLNTQNQKVSAQYHTFQTPNQTNAQVHNKNFNATQGQNSYYQKNFALEHQEMNNRSYSDHNMELLEFPLGFEQIASTFTGDSSRLGSFYGNNFTHDKNSSGNSFHTQQIPYAMMKQKPITVNTHNYQLPNSQSLEHQFKIPQRNVEPPVNPKSQNGSLASQSGINPHDLDRNRGSPKFSNNTLNSPQNKTNLYNIQMNSHGRETISPRNVNFQGNDEIFKQNTMNNNQNITNNLRNHSTLTGLSSKNTVSSLNKNQIDIIDQKRTLQVDTGSSNRANITDLADNLLNGKPLFQKSSKNAVFHRRNAYPDNSVNIPSSPYNQYFDQNILNQNFHSPQKMVRHQYQAKSGFYKYNLNKGKNNMDCVMIENKNSQKTNEPLNQTKNQINNQINKNINFSSNQNTIKHVKNINLNVISATNQNITQDFNQTSKQNDVKQNVMNSSMFLNHPSVNGSQVNVFKTQPVSKTHSVESVPHPVQQSNKRLRINLINKTPDNSTGSESTDIYNTPDASKVQNINGNIQDCLNKLYYAQDRQTIQSMFENIILKNDDQPQILNPQYERKKKSLLSLIEESFDMFTTFNEHESKYFVLFKIEEIKKYLSTDKVLFNNLIPLEIFINRMIKKVKTTLKTSGLSTEISYGYLFNKIFNKFEKKFKEDAKYVIHLGKKP